jgi:hypothetical protein
VKGYLDAFPEQSLNVHSSTYLPYVGAGFSQGLFMHQAILLHLMISAMGGFDAHYAIQEGKYRAPLTLPTGHSDQIHAKFFCSLDY